MKSRCYVKAECAWRLFDSRCGWLGNAGALILLSGFFGGVAVAQELNSDSALPSVSTGSVPRRLVSIVPRVAVTETYTDNATLSANSKQSDLITEISPGIRISGDAGRLKGHFDYSLVGRVSTQGGSATSTQSALSTAAVAEIVDKFAFLDFTAGISQQTVSALGGVSPGSYSVNANQSETSTYRISPYLKGSLAGKADYEARYSLSSTQSQSAGTSDVSARDFSISVMGRSSTSPLGWSVLADQQSSTYSLGRTTEVDRLTGTLSYAVNPQFVLSATAGQESNNFSTISKESSFTSGQGLKWTPSDNVSLSANRQNRPFGQSHSINFNYRTARTAWSFTDSQDVTNTPSQTQVGSLGSTYDLFFALFTSVEPDPVKRAVLVNSFLQANGINPNGAILSNFLTSAVAFQRRQSLSFSLLGVRDTITVIASRTDSSRVDSLSTALDDLTNSTSVRQSGLSLSYSHRLTPDSSMNITGAWQQSSDSKAALETSSNSVNIGFATKLGNRSSAAVSARRVIFDSSTSPYNETAITGTINVQF